MMKYGDASDRGAKRFRALLAVAAGFNTLWAGAATFKVVIELPARHRIGAVAFAELARATDLSAGLAFYPIAAIGSAILACATWVAARKVGAPPSVRKRAAVAALATLAVLAVTAVAAPIMFTIGSSANDPGSLAALEDRFALLTDIRAALADVGAIALVVALALE